MATKFVTPRHPGRIDQPHYTPARDEVVRPLQHTPHASRR